MNIREYTAKDEEEVWSILEPIVRAGDTYTLPQNYSKHETLKYWITPDKTVFVVEDTEGLLGTYYIRANRMGGGSHVCNCGYVTRAKARGRGVASFMCNHSLNIARTLGFHAMQYNCVVATNESAVRLWKRHGFGIVGTLPEAFNHPEHGYVDAFVMYRTL